MCARAPINFAPMDCPQRLASSQNGIAASTRVAVAPVSVNVARTAVVEVVDGKLKTRKAAAKVSPMTYISKSPFLGAFLGQAANSMSTWPQA